MKILRWLWDLIRAVVLALVLVACGFALGGLLLWLFYKIWLA